jgi:regulator of RNase E activity RraA
LVQSRDEVLERTSKLRTAMLSDSMDALGFSEQAMSPQIQALDRRFNICGFARTLAFVPTRRVGDWESKAFLVELALVDSLSPGDVVVASTVEACLWGELLSTASQLRGAVGAVIDAYSRDIEEILELNFPVYARGAHPSDSLGRAQAVDSDIPITCGGIQVSTGDLIVADADGVVIVPAAQLADVLEEAERKASAEGVVKAGLQRGESLLALYEEHHVL